MKPVIAALLAAVLLCNISTVQGGKPPGAGGKPGGGATKGSSFTAVNLGVLPGDAQSWANAVSESGSVVGESFFSDESGEFFSAAYWHYNGQGWEVYALPKGSSQSRRSYARGIAGPVQSVEYVAGQIGSEAVIWAVTGGTPVSPPVYLDPGSSPNCSQSSDAQAVNMRRDAAGTCDNKAAIWTAGLEEHALTVLNLPGVYAQAMDINDTGVVVGRNCSSVDADQCHAFVTKTGSSKIVELADQIAGDPWAYAAAVSEAVIVDGKNVVFVTGSTTSAGGVERGVRWTVPLAIFDSSSSDVVIQTPLTGEWCSGVNNAGGAVCTGSSGGRQTASLLRNGVRSDLKPPKGATDAASLDLARTGTLPTYAVGVAQVEGLRAVVWVINK